MAARQQGPDLLVQIRDSRKGIPPEHVERVFEGLYRIPQADGEQVEGASLGSTFSFTLPTGPPA